MGLNYKGKITSSYSTGLVSGPPPESGGLVGTMDDTSCVISSFWDIETSGKSSSDGGVGLPTVHMQDINTFLDEGWDLVDETTNGTDDIWWIKDGQDYPRLWWE